MGIRQVVECDICGKQKQETNNWFMAMSHEFVVSIKPICTNIVERSSKFKVICGEECAHKFLSQNLTALHPSKLIQGESLNGPNTAANV